MGKYNQEDEIAEFFREQDAALESEPEESKDDGLPSIMKALDELPQASSQTAAFAADGMQRSVTAPIGYHYSSEVRFDRKKESKEQFEHAEKLSRCTVLSEKYKQMFLILIGGAALSIISTILSSIASSNADFYKETKVFMIIIAAASAVLSVFYGVFLLGLGKYHLEFRTGGLYYIISGASSAVSNSTTGKIQITFQLLTAVFSVLYILKFAVAMSNSFDNVAPNMSVTWESYKKIFLYVYGGFVFCLLACFLPMVVTVVLLLLLILSVAIVAISIWQIALVLRSSQIMKQSAATMQENYR